MWLSTEGMAEPQQVTALAQMVAEVAAVRRDQAVLTRQQLAALQQQRERQTQLLEAMLVREGTTSPGPSLSGMTLHRMTGSDDAQSYLETFEATASACGWPEAEWAVWLLPLLSGDAQTAALGLPGPSRDRYGDVKRAILGRMSSAAEDHRRRFRGARLGPADRPFIFARQLKDAATRWLQPGDSAGEERLMGQIVAEQFLEGLPAATSDWVRGHRPADLAAAITLAEDHLVVVSRAREQEGQPSAPACPVPAPRRRPAPVPQRQAPARPTPPPRTNIPSPSPSLPPQGPVAGGAAPSPRKVPRAAGQECWRCRRPGHFRRECPVREVGQVIRVAGPSAPFPSPGRTKGRRRRRGRRRLLNRETAEGGTRTCPEPPCPPPLVPLPSTDVIETGRKRGAETWRKGGARGPDVNPPLPCLLYLLDWKPGARGERGDTTPRPLHHPLKRRRARRVKQALCGEPPLRTPNISLPFVFQTDASGGGAHSPSARTTLTSRDSTAGRGSRCLWTTSAPAPWGEAGGRKVRPDGSPA
ncbi:hypothetical protein PAMA_005593 [Pampus argenteus]